MGAQNLVNIGSGNGLVPSGTKPLPDQMLLYHQRDPVALSAILQNFLQDISP